ncbi:MAG: glycosyl hydrolase [Gemmatimonadetes bacterium]|nr:glycosyl hydrolase [Gemmatimonadota bacterium]
MRTQLRIPAYTALSLLVVGLGFAPEGQAQQYDESYYDFLTWSNVGIARGGRSTAVAGSDARPLEYYFGAVGGGLWKTTDGGNNWRPVTDGQINSSSVGAVAVCETDPDVVYIGTGETQLRGNVMQGDGVYKSTDAGSTWEHLGLAESQNIARIRVHPDNCDVAWVAAFGQHSSDNPERGVYKTTDGGSNWALTLFKSEKAGVTDLIVDPNDPDVLYATVWEAFRKSWGMSSGGFDSGLWKSTDGGDTWSDITSTLGLDPAGPIGKMGVTVSGANSDRVWVIVEHEPQGGVYRSDDGGATWEQVNDERKLRQRAFYYTRIYADPQDEDVVYALNTGFYKSTDGGVTFPRSISVPHGDNHDLWIAPSTPDRMVEANDGGANVSFNGGTTWTDQEYATAQFYRVITTNHEPYHICGAQQDNSTACTPSSGWNHLSAAGGFGGGSSYYYSVGGCESGYIAPHPEDLDIFYAGCYGGSLSRYDHGTGFSRSINVWPENPMGQSAEDIRERVQWTFPIVFDKHDSGILYTGTQKVWKTTTEGQSWVEISPDLTRNDPATVGASGGPITKDQTGVETYATVFAIAPSPHDANVIWAGSDDGYVHVTRNARAASPTWTNVTPSDAPDFVRINTIEVSPNTPGKAYVSGIRYLVDNDRSPYVWKTTNYGETWTKIVGGIPSDDFVRAVREDPVRPGMLYAASERTVYVSWNDGTSWQPLTMNLPVTQVSDLVVEDHDLVISTHGRSFWVMRSIGALRQMYPDVVAADFWLFDPQDPVRLFDNAVDINYYLKADAEKVTLEFLDLRGDVLASYESREEDAEEPEAGAGGGGGFGFGGGGNLRPSKSEGAHRFRWNQRLEGWTDFDGRIFWAAGNQGPAVLPGMYRVRLTVDGQSQTRDFEIKMNPRALAEGATLADLQERFDFAIRIRDRVTDANEAVLRMRSIKSQIDDRLEQNDNAELETLGATVASRLSGVEGEIYQVQNQSNQDPLNYPIKLNNKIAALQNAVEGSETRPTDQSYEVFDSLSDSLESELRQMDLIIQQDLARLNELLRELGLEPIDAGRLIT